MFGWLATWITAKQLLLGLPLLPLTLPVPLPQVVGGKTLHQARALHSPLQHSDRMDRFVRKRFSSGIIIESVQPFVFQAIELLELQRTALFAVITQFNSLFRQSDSHNGQEVANVSPTYSR